MKRVLLVIFCGVFFISCSDSETAVKETVATAPAVQTPAAAYSFQVFEIVDSAGTMHGVGYDIYQGDKRMIHQVNIPGQPGNNGFVNRDEAGKVAALVVNKLESNSGFPTITPEELDSLNITLTK